MKETELYHDLINAMENKCDRCRFKYHIVRIESNLTNQGILDIYCCIAGKSFWIECKVGNYMLSPLQISWMEQEYLAGGHAFQLRQITGNFYLKRRYVSAYIYTTDSLNDIVDKIFSDMNL